MRCPLKVLPLLIAVLCLSYGSVGSSFAQSQKQAGLPASPDSLSMPIFPSASPADDSLKSAPGDSIFIFSGELYYRARSGGRDFFVARDTLIAHADSLVIYQYYRLGSANGAAQSSDSAVTKVERQRCSAITQDGGRCKRLAIPGSDRCWQHRKK